jgi:hypothetical protein
MEKERRYSASINLSDEFLKKMLLATIPYVKLILMVKKMSYNMPLEMGRS